MKYIVGALWINVFVIAWLQMLKIIGLWPSSFYLVIFLVPAVVGTMIVAAPAINKSNDTK